MVERIKRREDTDGCTCLECRGIRSVVARRRLGDVFLWAMKLLPARPSMLLIFLGLAVIQFASQVWPARLGLPFAGVVLIAGLFAYCYTVTVAAGELVDRRYSPATAVKHSLRRLPTVLSTLLIWLAAMSLLVVTCLVAGVLAIGADSLPLTVVGLLVVLAAFSLLVTVAVKFLFATEAAIVGGYGPIASFRVSWTLVPLRRRTAILLLSLGGMLLTAFVTGKFGSTTEPYPVLGNETVRFVVFGLRTATTALSSGVTAIALCHFYVQGVLE
ncbi:hypothetical protein [Halopiger djelfimassiliensis]|uniref:hypothetical protein n=1 Tax=Halopiger djelfimassiliensis TaxID=1293047 RepID=UPI0006779D6B|nr:hypothetical protein [Halopiger djelfimassiliensis]